MHLPRRTMTLLSTAALGGLFGIGCIGQTSSDVDGSIHDWDDAMIRPPACSDGVDNDGDGLVDFPEDPGCADEHDRDEANGPFCGIAADGQAVFIQSLPPTLQVVENTAHGISHDVGSCGGADASEMVFSLTVTDSATSLLISTDGDPTLSDTVLYLRRDHCEEPSAEVACHADPASRGQELVLEHPEPGTYYIFVDGADPGGSGQFLLRVRWIVPESMACWPDDPLHVCAPGLICAADESGDPQVCTVPRCSDGLDNDGDGWVDFPEDPGCQSALDHSEIDVCPGPGCPACADGVDNDGDGLTDWPEDPDCDGAGSLLEAKECVPGLPIRWLPDTGDATGLLYVFESEMPPILVPSYTAPDCDPRNSGPEQVYALWLPDGAAYLESTVSSIPDGYSSGEVWPSVYLRRDDCSSGTELASDCSVNQETTVSVVVTDVEPGLLFVFADSVSLNAKWGVAFLLQVRVTLTPGARCDPFSGALSCPAGTTCTGQGEAFHCE